MPLRPYFDRIGFRASAQPDLETLAALHLLHPMAIPFENLNTLLGEPVLLERAALIDKLVHRQRGGYCFEQNSLFQYVLEEIGFDLVPIAARVVWNQDKGLVNPRTHMALIVNVDGNKFLCDVGFGAATLTAPLAFETGIEQTTPHEPFRILAHGDLFVLEVRFEDCWRAAYEFDLQPQRAIDYEAMNHYVQSHPASHFRRVLMAARPDATGRLALGGNRFTHYRTGAPAARRMVRSPEALAELLTRDFAIRLPNHQRLASLLERVANENGE
jgi:N-hydroxyarylamine O-acetyltransferase